MSTRRQSFFTSSFFWYGVIPACLILITAIAYSFSLNYAFQFDDQPNILKFYDIRFLTLNDLFFKGTRWISRWINVLCYGLGGFEPFVYRCANVLLHLSAGTVVYYFFLNALTALKKNDFFKTNAQAIATITASLFLLHPVQTQTVSYIVQGQLEGLAGLFVMAVALVFLLAYRTKTLFGRTILLLLMYTLAFFACSTKEVAIVTPFLILLIDWFFVAQGSVKSIKQRWWVHALLFGEVFGLYVWFMGQSYFVSALGLQLSAENLPGNNLTANSNEKILPYTFLISQFKVILHYLAMFIWPSISIEYDWSLESSIGSVTCMVPFLILMSMFLWIGSRLRANSTNLVSFGLLWFFICMAPRSSIIPAWELLADYKTYLASVGWLFVIAAALVWFFICLRGMYPVLRRTYAPLIVGSCFVLGLAGTTVWYNTVWESGLAFWSHILKYAPRKARAQCNFGVQLLEKKEYRKCLPYFKRAIKLEPRYYDPYNNLACAYGSLGKTDLAIMALREGLKINPYQPMAYNNLSRNLLDKKEYDWAIKVAEQAIAMVPHYGKAHYNLGQAHQAAGNDVAAWQSFKTCCTASDHSESPDALEKYAQLSMKLGYLNDAVNALERIIQRFPSAPMFFNLGNAYYQLGKFSNASAAFEEALLIDPTDFKILRNLAETLLSRGQPEEALKRIEAVERQFGSFDGLAIEKARALNLLGKKDLAYYTLTEYMITYPHSPLMPLAEQLIKEL